MFSYSKYISHFFYLSSVTHLKIEDVESSIEDIISRLKKINIISFRITDIINTLKKDSTIDSIFTELNSIQQVYYEYELYIDSIININYKNLHNNINIFLQIKKKSDDKIVSIIKLNKLLIL